jgi:hypothetical protein
MSIFVVFSFFWIYMYIVQNKWIIEWKNNLRLKGKEERVEFNCVVFLPAGMQIANFYFLNNIILNKYFKVFETENNNQN